MKIRALTVGISLNRRQNTALIQRAARFLQKARDRFTGHGIAVQTLRITTQPWFRYCQGMRRKQIIKFVRDCEHAAKAHGIGFLSIGCALEPAYAASIPDIIAATISVSASALISRPRSGTDQRMVRESARVIKKIAQITPGGYGNFRFAAIANCPPDIPFYPAGYHAGRMCFTIALEASDLLVQALARTSSLSHAQTKLRELLNRKFRVVTCIAEDIARDKEVMFRGLDTSPAPSLSPAESIVAAFEKLPIAVFGDPGTLTIAGAVTEVLRTLAVKSWGYCGLMLPVLEDTGLAQRWSDGHIDLNKMLLYSSACGTGLDCIPVPGATSLTVIQNVLTDMATIALRFNKPLSARLFPVPKSKAGDRVTFDSPHLVSCTLQEVS